MEANQVSRRSHGGSANAYRRRGALGSRTSLRVPYDTMSEASQMTEESQQSSTRSVPVQPSTSITFVLPKRQMQHDVSARSHGREQLVEPSSVLHGDEFSDSDGGQEDDGGGAHARKGATNLAMLWEQEQPSNPNSFHESQELYRVIDYTSDVDRFS